jgi:hypothetical protein
MPRGWKDWLFVGANFSKGSAARGEITKEN